MAFDIFAKITFIALIVMMVLPVIIVVRLSKLRFAHLAELKPNGDAENIARLRVSDAGWPTNVLQVQNAYKNQFELPILFYVMIVSSLAFGLADSVMMVLAVLFVLVRYAHAYVHTGSNYVRHRVNLFSASLGFVVLQMLYLSVMVLGA